MNGMPVASLMHMHTTPIWVRLTWAHTVAGDRVRAVDDRGNSIEGAVLELAAVTRQAESWHVVPGANRFGDRPGRWSEIRITTADGRMMGMRPDAPVDIRLAPAEVIACESMGWENRLSVLDTTADLK